MPTDEELGRAGFKGDPGQEWHLDLDLTWERAGRKTRERYIAIACAVQDALREPIEPFPCNHDIRIAGVPTSGPADVVFANNVEGEPFVGAIDHAEGDAILVDLDADGVRALRHACDRWLATEGD